MLKKEVFFQITQITTYPNGDIIVSGANGEQITIPGGSNTVITGANPTGGTGAVYNVDSQGNVTGPFTPAPGGATTPANTDGVASNGQTTQFTAQGITVTFEPTAATKYSWDTVAETAPSHIKDKYAKVGSTYLPYKAVVNGQSDVIKAKITLTDTAIKLEDIIFKTQHGILIDKVKEGDHFILTLKGTKTFAEEEVQAVIKQGDTYKVAGAFKLVHISEKPINVTLIPLNSSNSIPSSAIVQLQEVYAKAGVTLNLKTAPVLTYDGGDDHKVTTSESGVFDYYTDEEKTINAKIKALPDYDPKTYYLIYSNLPSDKGIDGFMALYGQFGYVFPSGGAKTAAHELAHGVFALQHPFSNAADKGKTPFLMDYGSGTELWLTDWAQINNPALKYYGFQGDSQGEFTNAHLTPDWEPFYYKESSTYIMPEMITEPNGAVYGIAVGEKKYYWETINNEKGFYCKDEKLKISKIVTEISDSLIIELYWNNGVCGRNLNFITTWEKIKSQKGKLSLDYLSQAGVVTSHSAIPCLKENIAVGITRHDIKCKGSFSEVYAKVKICKDFVASITAKSIDETVDFVLSSDFCGLKDVTIEEKIIFLKKVTGTGGQNSLFEREEQAIIKLLNVVKEEEIQKVYDEFYSKNNQLANLLSRINNKTIGLFGSDNLNYFLETLAYHSSKLKSDNHKWNVVNNIIKNRFNSIENGEYEKTALIQILTTVADYEGVKDKITNGILNLSNMLVQEIKPLNDYKTILDIALIRVDNKEAFSNFTQGDKIQFNLPGLLLDNNCSVASNSNWSWIKPGPFKVVCTNQSFKDYTQSEVDIAFKWANYLSKNANIKSLLNNNIPEYLVIFKDELNKFITEKGEANAQFWDTAQINCNELSKIINHININENGKTLSSLNSQKRLNVIETFFNCNDTGNTITLKDSELFLLKILTSFESTDNSILKRIEAISLEKIYSKLKSSDKQWFKFVAWLGAQIQDCNYNKPVRQEDLLNSNGVLRSDSQLTFKLESNMFDFQNLNGSIKGNKLTVNGITLDYTQMVPVYAYDNFEFAEQKIQKGTVLVMPIIQAFAMGKNNRNIVSKKAVWTGLDVVLLFTGIGEVKVFLTAGNYIRKAIVLSDLVGSASGIALNVINESALDPDTRFKLQMLSLVASLPHVATSIKGIDNIVTSIDDKINIIADVSSRSSLKEYFASIKARIPTEVAVNQLLAKLKNSAVWARYESLSPAMKKIFENDFANASDGVIDLLKKQDSELFAGWKKFRTKNPKAIICN
ncbi:hypothetical protein [Flavobacterium columnare]|uniref:hypothetical protein n=1 Tax=Flavobacterium columnare TaxID=996 RepID=UPI003B9F67E8